MKREPSLHKVQVQIVRALFMSDGMRFARLNTMDITNDHFSYHIRKLIKDGYIYKDKDGLYHLTTYGKTSAILLDTKQEKYIRQGFTACRVVLTRMHNGEKQYLLQRRTKVPFRGYLAEPGGKILWGETVTESAQRNMKEQTGLDCDMTIQGQIHIHDVYEESIVQDKYFYVVSAKVSGGELQEAGPTGTNHWLTLEEIQSDPKAHKGVLTICKIAESDEFTFVEETHETHEY